MIQNFSYYRNNDFQAPVETGQYPYILFLECDHGISTLYLLAELGQINASDTEVALFCHNHSLHYSCSCAMAISAIYGTRKYLANVYEINTVRRQ